MSKTDPNGVIAYSRQQKSRAGGIAAGTVYFDMHSDEPRIATARMGAATVAAKGIRVADRRQG